MASRFERFFQTGHLSRRRRFLEVLAGSVIACIPAVLVNLAGDSLGVFPMLLALVTSVFLWIVIYVRAEASWTAPNRVPFRSISDPKGRGVWAMRSTGKKPRPLAGFTVFCIIAGCISTVGAVIDSYTPYVVAGVALLSVAMQIANSSWSRRWVRLSVGADGVLAEEGRFYPWASLQLRREKETALLTLSKEVPQNEFALSETDADRVRRAMESDSQVRGAASPRAASMLRAQASREHHRALPEGDYRAPAPLTPAELVDAACDPLLSLTERKMSAYDLGARDAQAAATVRARVAEFVEDETRDALLDELAAGARRARELKE